MRKAWSGLELAQADLHWSLQQARDFNRLQIASRSSQILEWWLMFALQQVKHLLHQLFAEPLLCAQS